MEAGGVILPLPALPASIIATSEPGSLCRRRQRPRARRAGCALVTIVAAARLDAAARGRQDAGLWRRPHRRHGLGAAATRTTPSGRPARPSPAGVPSSCTTRLDDDFAQETGLICGGQMDVYIEPIEPSPELYVIGAGHVGFHLARWPTKSGSGSTSWTIARSSRTASDFPTPSRLWWTTFRRGSPAHRFPPMRARSSSRADTRTTSRRCAPSRRVSCATSA